MSALLQLVRRSPDRARLALFVLAGALAVVVGFFSLDPPTAARLIKAWGYYYILGVFAGFLVYATRLARARRAVWSGWLRRPGRAGFMIAAGTAFALWAEPFRHKVLFDEYVIQGTGFQMHAAKEVGTVLRAYYVGGSWLSINTFLDKRPYFFPFLLSLLHDLTGYRMANAFVLNAGLAAALLGLLYWFGRELAGRGPALVAVGLMATLPLFAQNATGAGMDLHNLVMIVLTACLSLLYLRAPDDDRLSALVFVAVLLAESRYESIIFLGPVACVIAAGWVRAGRILLPWPALAAPLLLVPYAWHNRVVASMPIFWQLQAGQKSPFSAGNVVNNLKGAGSFLFNFGPAWANSWYLSILGTAGLGLFAARAARWARTRPRPSVPAPVFVAVAFGFGVAAHFGVLLFYWWARFDDLMAARFALPICAAFALLAAALVRFLNGRGLPGVRLGFAGLGIWLLLGGLPAIARRLYTDQNLVQQEVEWERDVVLAQPGPVLFITNSSTIAFLLWHIQTIGTGTGAVRGDQIRYHLSQGTFREVLIAQAIRPTSERGDLGVDPDDRMPDNYQLVTLAEKRFGGKLARISRLVAIRAAPPARPAAAPAK